MEKCASINYIKTVLGRQFKWGVFLDCDGALRAIAMGDTFDPWRRIEVKNLVYMLEHPVYLEVPGRKGKNLRVRTISRQPSRSGYHWEVLRDYQLERFCTAEPYDIVRTYGRP